jgi:hypothetical protein
MIIIDDDFLIPEVRDQVEKEVFAMPFYFNPRTGSIRDNVSGVDGDFLDFPMFVSGRNSAAVPEPIVDVGSYILAEFTKKHNIVVSGIDRIKSNMSFRSKEKLPAIPHVDTHHNYSVLLYYVSDSDGDTILYDQFGSLDKTTKEKDLTIVNSVSPLKGRAVMFESNRFHCWVPPIESDMRCVININFRVGE